MASYAKGNTTKSRFILSAYKHIQDGDYEMLTVRALAQENGYSVAALYKHFDSLKYLLVVASVKFLDEYMALYTDLLDGSKSPLEIFIEGWNAFIDCAFKRPDIFYRLFWETDQEELEHAFIDYYGTFPDEDPNLTAVKFSVFILPENPKVRDVSILNLIVKDGLMDAESIDFISSTNELIASGLVRRAISVDDEERESLREECRDLIMTNIKHCLKEK